MNETRPGFVRRCIEALSLGSLPVGATTELASEEVAPVENEVLTNDEGRTLTPRTLTGSEKRMLDVYERRHGTKLIVYEVGDFADRHQSDEL